MPAADITVTANILYEVLDFAALRNQDGTSGLLGIPSTDTVAHMVDDNGYLAIGLGYSAAVEAGRWKMYVTEETLANLGLTGASPTLTASTAIGGQKFAIRNMGTGRFINVKGLTVATFENAVDGQQILMSDFESDPAFFWGIAVFPTNFKPSDQNDKFIDASFYNGDLNANNGHPGAGVGIWSILGEFTGTWGSTKTGTMKASRSEVSGRYAVQFLQGTVGDDGEWSDRNLTGDSYFDSTNLDENWTRFKTQN